MTSNPRVDAAFRELAPAIFEAWLTIAPERPSDECVIAIPIPSGIVWRSDRRILESVIGALFVVKDAQTVESIDPRFPVPGIRVIGRSWDRYQEIVAKSRAAEVA